MTQKNYMINNKRSFAPARAGASKFKSFAPARSTFGPAKAGGPRTGPGYCHKAQSRNSARPAAHQGAASVDAYHNAQRLAL